VNDAKSSDGQRPLAADSGGKDDSRPEKSRRRVRRRPRLQRARTVCRDAALAGGHATSESEWTQQYEWAYHYGFALEEGLAKATVDAIAEGRRPEGMREDEAVAYDFSIELHRTRRVSDATYARALKLFGEQGIIDLIGVSGYYTFNAMMMNVARSKVDIDNVPPLQRFPEQ
jgi:hypothetical protein